MPTRAPEQCDGREVAGLVHAGQDVRGHHAEEGETAGDVDAEDPRTQGRSRCLRIVRCGSGGHGKPLRVRPDGG